MATFLRQQMLSPARLSWFCGIASFLLTLCIGWGALINADGILYLFVAHQMELGQWQSALHTYGWAFYPLLIAGVHQLLPFLALEQAALLLNAVFYGILAYCYVRILSQWTPDRRVIAWGSLLILLLPGLNDYRDYIIRDAGAFALLYPALMALVAFHAKPSLSSALAWHLCMLLAFLFRIEMAVLWLLGPCGLWFTRSQGRRYAAWIALQAPLVLIGILAAWAAYWHPVAAGRIEEIPHYFLALLKIPALYAEKAAALAPLLNDQLKEKHALVLLMSGMLTYFMYLFIALLSPVYLGLIGLSAWLNPPPKGLWRLYSGWFFALSALSVLVFLGTTFFLSSRYLIPMVLLACLWAPFGLAHFSAFPRWATVTLSVLLLYTGIAGLTHWGYPKTYYKTAGAFIQTNIPPTSRVFIHDIHMAYYAQRWEWLGRFPELNNAALERGIRRRFAGYDVVAISFNHKQTERLAQLHALFPNAKYQIFENKRHDGVCIIWLNLPK